MRSSSGLESLLLVELKLSLKEFAAQRLLFLSGEIIALSADSHLMTTGVDLILLYERTVLTAKSRRDAYAARRLAISETQGVDSLPQLIALVRQVTDVPSLCLGDYIHPDTDEYLFK